MLKDQGKIMDKIQDICDYQVNIEMENNNMFEDNKFLEKFKSMFPCNNKKGLEC